MFLHHQQRCDPNVKGSRHPSGEAPVQRDCSAKVSTDQALLILTPAGDRRKWL